MVDRQERLWDAKLLMCEAHYHMGEYALAEREVETALQWNPRDVNGKPGCVLRFGGNYRVWQRMRGSSW